MTKKIKVSSIIILCLACSLLAAIYFHHTNIAVLNPKGPVARSERNLMIIVFLMSLIIVIPVFVATIAICMRYRETNKHAKYTPNWDHGRKIEMAWWILPSILIAVLSVITWRSTQALAPSKALVSKNPTMIIQVVALDWRWLFIYPKQNIATINYVAFPKQTPVDFEITADAPMNSFWIPQLGGQIYAMAGMTTNLNLMASEPGNFRGLSANISGDGFSGMDFMAHATSESNFERWVLAMHNAKQSLTTQAYDSLTKPSENNAVGSYAGVQPYLFSSIQMKYMMPTTTASTSAQTTSSMDSMPSMDMQ
jgi:cytochrome o ubiquinol oxidase subunit 2